MGGDWLVLFLDKICQGPFKHGIFLKKYLVIGDGRKGYGIYSMGDKFIKVAMEN